VNDPDTTPTEHRPTRLPVMILALIFACAFSFGAITTFAWAGHYHTSCVAHGFVHGDYTTDGSFFARVIDGCGATTKRCDLYTYGSFIGGYTVGGTATCSAWSLEFGNYTECASKAQTYYYGVFSDHAHLAHNYCA
jgi:hypothetical protein